MCIRDRFTGPAGEVRPGHTDLVKFYQSKGFTDPRGGGRSSYRSTISDVVGGSIARIFLREHFHTVILSSIYQVGSLKAKKRLGDQVEELVTRSSVQEVPLDLVLGVEKSIESAAIH